MTIKQFESVNAATITIYSIRSKSTREMVAYFMVDYSLGIDQFNEQAFIRSKYMNARIIAVDWTSSDTRIGLYVFAEI